MVFMRQAVLRHLESKKRAACLAVAIKIQTRMRIVLASRRYVIVRGLICLCLCLEDHSSTPLLSCSISSGALESPDLLPLRSLIALALYNTFILIINHLSTQVHPFIRGQATAHRTGKTEQVR